MNGLFQSAWLGWRDYISDGKLPALLLASLLFLWLGRKRGCRSFVFYALVMTICCILPVTAALLMVYQTGFYGYEQIWGFVPATAVTAYGFAYLLAESWPDLKPGLWRKGMPVAVLLLAAIFLSGSLGVQAWDGEREKQERQQADAVLEQLLGICPAGEIYLWAPREIMEYAREKDAGIRLLYGRDMWDSSLIGYTYDTYDENKIRLYQWMETASEARSPERNQETAALAAEQGVNCVLLPGDTDAWTVQYIEEALGAKALLAGDYYFLISGVYEGIAYE